MLKSGKAVEGNKTCCLCPLWVKGRYFRMSARCLLYPRKRTLFSTVAMSAKCQKQTSPNPFDRRGLRFSNGAPARA
jgi:hypothetical protein